MSVVSPYDGRRIFTFYEAAKQLHRGEMCKPRMGLVYPSRVCSQDCVYCSDREGNKRIGGFMQDDLLLSLPKQLKELGCESVELCGGGEPLMHPKITSFIKECVKEGLKLATLTNAVAIKGELLDLIAKHFSYVRISLDSFEEDTYNRVRRPKTEEAKLPAVLENIAALIKRKGGRGKEPLVGVKACFMKDYLSEMCDFVVGSDDLGADSVTVKFARNVGEVLKDEHCLELLEDFKYDYEGTDFKVSGSLDNFVMKERCWLSPFHVFVDCDGSVKICCYSFKRESKHTYGNMHDRLLREIWYSKEHIEAMKNIKKAECNKLGFDCKYIPYHEIIKEAMLEGKAQWEFI